MDSKNLLSSFFEVQIICKPLFNYTPRFHFLKRIKAKVQQQKKQLCETVFFYRV